MNCPNCQMPIEEGGKFCTNCGTPVVPINQMQQIPPQPTIQPQNLINQPGVGSITISRPSNFVGCAVSYKVFANGYLLGNVSDGGIMTFPLNYGMYEISIKCGMGKGNTKITVSDQCRHFVFQCPMTMGMWSNKIDFILMQVN